MTMFDDVQNIVDNINRRQKEGEVPMQSTNDLQI